MSRERDVLGEAGPSFGRRSRRTVGAHCDHGFRHDLGMVAKRSVAGVAGVGWPRCGWAPTEWVGKPLVDRRIDGVHPTFPSGHVTAAAAIAALLFVATRRTATTKCRLILAMVVWVIPAAVAVSVLRLGWHVATDALAGIGVGAGVVFGTLGVLTVAANAISGAGTARHKSGLRR